ncbi:hypothetical protein CLOM_g4742 [Closterium sp. NIES-68]|nr:hypothetical protein CLOM_g4742 [Closterium sp. NIES-68]
MRGRQAEETRGEQGGAGASKGETVSRGGMGSQGGQRYGVQAVQREAWWTAFQTGAAVSTEGVPQCSALLPADLQALNHAPLAPTAGLSVADLTLPDVRWLLVLPRHGVGNTLRGWVSAVAYAALAGRTLVRAHAAAHSRVFDALCLAFRCGFRCSEDRSPWQWAQRGRRAVEGRVRAVGSGRRRR